MDNWTIISIFINYKLFLDYHSIYNEILSFIKKNFNL